jgi:putative membrane protein
LTDNVDIFKKIVFTIPSFRKVFVASLVLSLVYATGVFLGAKLFTSVTVYLYFLPLGAFSVFLLPGLLQAEVFHRLIDEYPRRWSYFLALSNTTILFIYGLILTGADNFTNAWQIFWLGLTTVYISNLLVALLTVGYRQVLRIATGSLVQPLTVLSVFHILNYLNQGMSPVNYLSGIYVIAVAGTLVFSVLGLLEYLIKSNLENTSVLQLTAGLIQKKQEKLELGYPTKPDVQTVQIENKESEMDIAVPWIHPGPLEGFGGGRITSNIIQKLNSSGKGFYFHVPSTHKSDPSNPEDYRKIFSAMQEPEKTGEASELFTESYENVKFYGRKIGDRKIVFMDAEWDDYELSVFREKLDLDEVVLVDLHCHDRKEEDREEVWYNTEDARYLRESLDDFLNRLEEQELYQYSAGFHTDLDGKPVFALVEEVKGEETVLIGVEGNGTSEELRELGKELEDSYDEVLLLSTDTHQSIHDLSTKKQLQTSRIEETVRKASDNVSNASIGFENRKAEEMKLLQEDYSGLVFSINMLIRLMIFLLAAVYIWLVVWVFF